MYTSPYSTLNVVREKSAERKGARRPLRSPRSSLDDDGGMVERVQTRRSLRGRRVLIMSSTRDLPQEPILHLSPHKDEIDGEAEDRNAEEWAQSARKEED